MTIIPRMKEQSPTRLHQHYVLLMLLGGLFLSLAFPNEIIPGRLGDRPPALLAWLALLPVMWAVQSLSARQARRAVWLFGLAFYLGTLTWVRLFGYLPWVLLAGYLSLTPWLALLLTQRMPQQKWVAPLGFALAWTGLEWLRGCGLFGFPWSEVGASQVEGFTAHLAGIGGIPLISFLLLWSSGVAMQWLRDRRPPRAQVAAVLTVALLCLLAAEWQTHGIMAHWQRQPRTLHLSVVQPNSLRGLNPEDLIPPRNIEEEARWAQKRRDRLNALLALSYQAAATERTTQITDAEPRLIIWPESALPDPPTDWEISTLTLRTGNVLLIGAPFMDYDQVAKNFFLRNSAYYLGPGGVLMGHYDKMHLVPFGEFVPLRQFVSKYYTVRPNDIIPGLQRQTLPLGTHRMGVAICFESTFPDIAREYVRQQAHVLIVITNDAWFHQTNAVRQHLNHARFRAIETGLPVARAAGTGISAFIAPDGRLLAAIPTYTAGMRTMSLPPGTPGTLFSKVGWLFGPGCLLAGLALAIMGMLLRRKSLSANTTS